MEKHPVYSGQLSDENIRGIFIGAGDFCVRKLKCGPFTLCAYAIDGLISGADASDYIIKPIVQRLAGESMQQLYDNALEGAVYNSVAKECKDLDSVASLLVNGFCVVLFPEVGALAFEVKTGEKRSIAGPELEHTAKGPKDAFVETVRTNTSLIRRHLRTPSLRLYETVVGTRSLTNVTVVWVEGITDEKLVQRMKQRLDSVDVDGLLSPSAVEEYVTGSRATPFPLLQYTERTDSFCQGLLNGRVGLLVDGLPLGYLAPVDIGYMMNSPEDLGRDFISASWVRILRYLALCIGLVLPALYIAFTVFHRQLLPSMFLQMVDEGRKEILWSVVWETLGLLAAFELLQESGVHLPQNIGQSVSIIGGIVVGTAAVEAGLVAPLTLVIISITGICGFVIPNRDFAGAIRLCRFVLTVLASVAGLFGVGAGLLLLGIHLCSIKSLGVPYVILFAPQLWRRRLVKEKYRDQHLHPRDKRKQK